jgi:PIN domain nuclease of toxin-antitoxin system
LGDAWLIVLDTHVLIWWINDDGKLSTSACGVIEAEQNHDGTILVSSITAWEIALLVEKGRLTLTTELNLWLQTIASIDGVKFVPVNNELAIHSVQLPGEFHSDPADRIITALARLHTAPLVTSDVKIREYNHVKTVW